MKGQLVILFLSAAFLVQYCDAVSNARSAEFTDGTDQFTLLIKDYKISIATILKSSKNYLERSQAEISGGVERKWSQLSTTITELLTDINTIPAESENQDIPTMYSCLEKVISFPIEYALRWDEEALELLARNGLNTFLADFHNVAVNFNPDFERVVTSYLANVPDDKKVNEREMAKWFYEYKKIKDSTKKFKKSREFFEKFSTQLFV